MGASRRIGEVMRRLGSLLGVSRERRSAESRVIRPWRQDSMPSGTSGGLTPARALSFLQSADQGTPQRQFELFAEMLQRWPRLGAVEQTRRLALTGLAWEVTPGPTDGLSSAERQGAEEAAAFCRAVLAQVPRLREALASLSSAIGYGIAVAELVWDDGRLADIVPAPHTRLVSDASEPWRLRVLTEEEPTRGVALDEQPFKWIVHQPRATAGRPFGGGLLRASTLLYLAQHLSFKDWLVYSQLAGMPTRVAQFEPGVSDEDQQQLLRMLQTLGTEAVAAFSKNVDLKIVEPSRSNTRLYQQLQEYCNTEVTILWLGQHLTTDIRQSGSRAAAEIHDRVREDLLADDIFDEAETIRREVLTPIVQAKFGPGVPTPQFRRSLMQSVDSRVLAETLAVAVNEVGLSVPRRWAHEALGIPEARASEPVLQRGETR